MSRIFGLFVAAFVAASLVCLLVPSNGFAQTGSGTPPKQEVKQSDSKQEEKADWKKLTGSWECEKAIFTGRDLPKETLSQIKLKMTRGKYVATTAAGSEEGEIKLNTAASPRQMEIQSSASGQKMTIRAIYKFDDDKLVLCYGFGEKFPEKFESTEDNGNLFAIYKRASKKETDK